MDSLSLLPVRIIHVALEYSLMEEKRAFLVTLEEIDQCQIL